MSEKKIDYLVTWPTSDMALKTVIFPAQESKVEMVTDGP